MTKLALCSASSTKNVEKFLFENKFFELTNLSNFQAFGLLFFFGKFSFFQPQLVVETYDVHPEVGLRD